MLGSLRLSKNYEIIENSLLEKPKLLIDYIPTNFLFETLLRS